MSRDLRSVVLPPVLVALVLALAGCSSAASPLATEAPEAAEAGVRVVQPTEAADLLAAEPDRVVIDVRTPAEFAAGHLEGAVLVDYEAADFRDRVAELDRDASYLVYCRSGNRSAGARQVMEDLGFTDVVDVAGGITAWAGAGLPVATG